jgi:branched-chain amino acid transport system substrate-binding protein
MVQVLVLTLVLALVVASAPPIGPSPASGADKVLRVGAPLPLTGPLSPEGLKQKRGYDLWAAQVNTAGGIKVGSDRYRVEIVYHDYQSNTPRAVQLAEKLISDNRVNFLFSPFGSGATKAASGVAEKYGIPTIAPTASSEEVYNQGYKYLFGTFTPNSTLTEPLADIVKSQVREVKQVAILARSDLFPLAIGADGVLFEEHDLEPALAGRLLHLLTLDHASALTQSRAARSQWIFATGYINDLILIRKQMADLGVTAAVVTMIAGPAYKEFVDATGPLAENVTSAAWWHPAVRYKGVDVFGSTERYNQLYQAAYGAVPDYVEASSSACGVILQLAIEKAGSIDPRKVRDALASLDLMTFYGPVRFGPTGQIVSLEPPVFQIQGGKPVVIFPAAIRQGELRTGVK